MTASLLQQATWFTNKAIYSINTLICCLVVYPLIGIPGGMSGTWFFKNK